MRAPALQVRQKPAPRYDDGHPGGCPASCGRPLVPCRRWSPSSGAAVAVATDGRSSCGGAVVRRTTMERPCSAYGCPAGHAMGSAWGSAVSSRRSHGSPSLRVGIVNGMASWCAFMSSRMESPPQRLAPLVAVADEVPRELHPQAARIPGLPGVVAHLLAGGIKPRDVLDVLAIDRAPLEELPALKDRLRAAHVRAPGARNRRRPAARPSAPRAAR